MMWGMEWIASWIDGISDTWLRIFAVAGAAGLVLGAIGLGLTVYQMVTGWRAVRLDRAKEERAEIRQFLFNVLGKRTEIGGLKNFGAMEGAAQVGVKKDERYRQENGRK